VEELRRHNGLTILFSAHGFVLSSGEKPIVFVAVDWCEIRNDAYDRWRAVLAEAARTTRERVLVTSVHAHDAPVADPRSPTHPEQHKPWQHL
jgi:hypothetical protein